VIRRRAPARLAGAATLVVLALGGPRVAHAQKQESTSLTAAAERSVVAAPTTKAGTPRAGARTSTAGRPAVRGPKLPPEVLALFK
jgi:hypothetical protein